MNSLSGRKYKDELPINTINKIRNILSGLGILTIETGWRNSAEGFYSVTIMIQNTNLTTNGKGTTYEYALASAYGELMERLQNQSFYKLSINLSKDALDYKGFYYAPDEKQMSISDLINSDDDWINSQFSKLDLSIDKNELLKKWIPISYEDIPSDFIALPYFNLSNGRLSHIPIKMISKMYMSNGMCGGNTAEEALVQGISEVLERYVNKTIIVDKIVPPTIPQEYIKKFPRIDAMITQIESSGNYDVVLKDCSLGEGYPVVGVLFINKDHQTYFIKFGAHPMFEIAAERTLTELLQGQDVKNMSGVKDFIYRNEIDDMFKNLIDVFVNGCGYYPSEIFIQKFTYGFKEFENPQELSNKEMLIYLIDLIQKKGYDIFVRNVSFLGFPSFHIIVPGLSEIEEIDDIKELDDYSNYNKIKKYIRNLDNVSNEQIEEIIEYLSNENINSDFSVVQLLNVPIRNLPPWYYANIDLFITALHYKKGDFINAYKSFDKYLKRIQPDSYNKGLIAYYKCVRDYIGTRIDNSDEKDIIETLSAFYPPVMINGVINEFGNHKQVFSRYGQINCWNCEKCKLKAQCSYDSVEKVYKSLKDRYASSEINQNEIKELLNL